MSEAAEKKALKRVVLWLVLVLLILAPPLIAVFFLAGF